MYKRIAAIDSPDDSSDVLDELVDRFGPVPDAVNTLVSVSLIRVAAGKLGFYEVKSRKDEAVLLFGDNIDSGRVSEYIKKRLRRVLVSKSGKSHIAAEVKAGESITDVAVEVLENLFLA